MEISSTRYSLGKQVPWFSKNKRAIGLENVSQQPCNFTTSNSRKACQRLTLCQTSNREHPSRNVICRAHSFPLSLKEPFVLQLENYPSNDESVPQESHEDIIAQPLDNKELKSLLADSERAKLIKKLSEANQQNRFLKRQLHIKEDALVNFKSELAVMELEIQALATLAEEIANSSIPEGSRKIHGKYIQSHLLSRLQAVLKKLKVQIKDVEATHSKEVPIFWVGMAESVQVMGTFDGWSQGEHLSPEYTGSFTKFSTSLMLRPGRYEIKFLVDGEWKLSPEFPSVGEGLMKNNLLVVE